MGVEILQGFTGGGKSFVCMLKMVDHLHRGGVVGTNIRFTDDFCLKVAGLSPDFLDGKMSLEECVRSVYQRCFLLGNHSTIKDLALTGADLCVGRVALGREKKIFIVIDEAGLYMSPQTYRENMPWLQLMTQSRKLKLDVVLIAHDISFIDNKVRKLCSIQSRVINMSEEVKIPGIDVGWPRGDIYPRIPRPTFIYVRKSTLGGRNQFIFHRYRSEIAELYDTDEIFDYDSLPSSLEYQGVFPDFSVPDAADPEVVPRKSFLSMDYWPGHKRFWWDAEGVANY
jgi:hypothetical protein